MKHRIWIWIGLAAASASAQTLQERVDAAQPGEEILVPPGRYAEGGRRPDGQAMFYRVVLDKPVTLRGEEGAGKTFIIGDETTGGVWLGDGARLAGFTVMNGHSAEDGGGVRSEPGGVVSDCILSGNTAQRDGGGLWGGRAERCVLSGNAARRSGGGAAQAQLDNCILHDNRAGLFGGGAAGCTLRNATLVRNHAGTFGGGAAAGRAQNTVLWENTSPISYRNVYRMEMEYCLTSPVVPGPGNISADPRFEDAGANVFRPVFNSPLADAGAENGLTDDFYGRPRVLDGNNDGTARPDIGAIEYVHPTADSDGDGIPDREALRSAVVPPGK